MKRRSFFSLLAGLVGIPLVSKKAVAQAPAVEPYIVAVDWTRDSVSLTATGCRREQPGKVALNEQQKAVMQEVEAWLGEHKKNVIIDAWQKGHGGIRSLARSS